ncbi:MAG: class I SAM-dependent methyltransferase [Bdellovibrionales bacterium]|nr:class I SAM-dependent methyltransferase [Bdellovibrionales bacterium]
MKKSVSDCPLCLDCNAQEYAQDKRDYYLCSHCKLIFVPRTQLISVEDERQRYQRHQNESENASYQAYLSQIAFACEPHLKKNSHGLDFGCGPSPLLAQIFTQHGFPTTAFDLFFHPALNYKQQKYDFIILSEVIEHLRSPREVMTELKTLLKTGGSIFVKTKFYPERNLFNDWFYKRDSTHIQFFSKITCHYLADIQQLKFVGEIGPDLYQFTDCID